MNVRGGGQLLQRLGNGRVEAPDQREPLGEERLEGVEAVFQRNRPGQAAGAVEGCAI